MLKNNRKKREFPTWDSFVIEEFKRDPEFLRLALKRRLKEYAATGDDFFLRETLKQAAAAKGITNLAKETGLSRQYLYEMLSEKGNPTIKVFSLVLKAFGYRMVFKPI
jgi:probable addiction module antidote protein